jgi:predicted secreted protein
MGRAAVWLAVMVAASSAAHAQVLPDPKNRVSFSAERSRDVANDWVTAVIGTSDEDSDAARLADRVNQTMKWALDTAKKARGVEVKSGGYTTHPVYGKDGKIARWGASQDLILESADVDAVSELVGKLQSRLLLRSIAFSVSPETRAKVEEALIGELLAGFQERSKKIQEGLGARDWELVSLSIQTPGMPGPVPMYARAEMAMDKAVAAPSFESGQSTLTIRADGTIELER